MSDIDNKIKEIENNLSFFRKNTFGLQAEDELRRSDLTKNIFHFF